MGKGNYKTTEKHNISQSIYESIATASAYMLSFYLNMPKETNYRTQKYQKYAESERINLERNVTFE